MIPVVRVKRAGGGSSRRVRHAGMSVMVMARILSGSGRTGDDPSRGSRFDAHHSAALVLLVGKKNLIFPNDGINYVKLDDIKTV